MCVSTLSVSVAVDEEPVSECCCFSPNKCGVPIDDRKDSTNTWKQGVEVTSSTMTGCVSSDDDEDGHDNDNDRENEDEDEDSDDVEDTYRDTDIDTTNDSLLTLSPNVNVTITKCLVDGSDYNQQSDSIIDSDPMKICYVIEPSPLTYFSGYASVYQSLFKHALNNQTQDELQLVTTECHVPQPVTWCPDGDAAAITTTTTATPASVSILDYGTDHCCERESLTSCSRNTSCSSSNSISSTLSSNTSNSSCCSREMPVYHAFGLPVVAYPSATVSFDCTMLLWRILWRCRPDIVHSTTPSSFNFPTILYCRLLRIPLLLSYHTHIPLLPEYYLKKEEWEQSKSSFRHVVLALISFAKAVAWLYLHVMHYFADSMIVVSPQIQDEFRNRGMDVDVWQKGIDAEKFSPAHYNTDMRQRMIGNRTDEPFLLLHSGRFALEKRIHLLKHVLKKLPDDVHLCLVGRGPDEGRLRNLFLNDDATKSRVTFTGYLTGTELSQAMASADTFIMQSDSETLGLVVLESLASAVPVVGVAALGVSGSINHGVTGFLCDNDDELVDSIVERVVQLKNDHTLRIRMAKAARAETLLWSVEAASDKLRNVQYKNCIANHDNRFDIKFWNMVRSSSTKKQKTC